VREKPPDLRPRVFNRHHNGNLVQRDRGVQGCERRCGSGEGGISSDSRIVVGLLVPLGKHVRLHGQQARGTSSSTGMRCSERVPISSCRKNTARFVSSAHLCVILATRKQSYDTKQAHPDFCSSLDYSQAAGISKHVHPCSTEIVYFSRTQTSNAPGGGGATRPHPTDSPAPHPREGVVLPPHLCTREALEDLHKLERLGRVEAEEGLVQQQNPAVGQQFHRQRQEALLALREVDPLDPPAALQASLLDHPAAAAEGRSSTCRKQGKGKLARVSSRASLHSHRETILFSCSGMKHGETFACLGRHRLCEPILGPVACRRGFLCPARNMGESVSSRGV